MALDEKIKLERERVTKLVIENIEKNNGLKWLKDWISNGPQNGINPEVKYKGMNFLKLVCDMEARKTDDPRYMTYNQAKSKGYNVKKSAKGLMCEHWCFIKIEKEKLPDGTVVEIEKPMKVPVVTTFYLFHVSDINGVPKYEPTKNKILKGKYKEIIDRLVETSEAPVDFKAVDQAFYVPSKDIISLPPKKMFKSKEGLLATLLHEIAHSTGHETRLNRDLGGRIGTPDYAKEELIAEFTSIFSQIELGLNLKEDHIDNHSAYLNSWLKNLKENPEALSKAIGSSERATNFIVKKYKGEEVKRVVVPLTSTENISNVSPLAM